MRINAEAAREYYQHKSQRRGTFHPNDLHDNGILYHAAGGVCLAFHRVYWPGVWMVHLAAKPEAWGNTEAPTREILVEFSAAEKPARIIAWVRGKNRAIASLALRVGFQREGGMTLPGETIDFYGWGADNVD